MPPGMVGCRLRGSPGGAARRRALHCPCHVGSLHRAALKGREQGKAQVRSKSHVKRVKHQFSQGHVPRPRSCDCRVAGTTSYRAVRLPIDPVGAVGRPVLPADLHPVEPFVVVAKWMAVDTVHTPQHFGEIVRRRVESFDVRPRMEPLVCFEGPPVVRKNDGADGGDIACSELPPAFFPAVEVQHF